MRTSTVRPASASTIQTFDVDSTPSLIGFWSCSDATGTKVRDFSKHGHHLTIQHGKVDDPNGLGVGDVNRGPGFWWGENPGWLTLKHGDRASITPIAGTPLATGTNHVVAVYEIMQHSVFSDADMGQAWYVYGQYDDPQGPKSNYLGYSLSSGGVGVLTFRTSIDKAVYDDMGAYPTSRLTVGFNIAVGNSGPDTIAGAFVPGVANYASLNGSATESLALDASVTELETQLNTFGLKSSYAVSNVADNPWTAIRNYQLWSFETLPPNLDMTLQWLSASPGKLPPWWVGL